MSQVDDYVIPGSPLTMSTLKTELDAMFEAAASQNKGSTAPSNQFNGMFWLDDSANPHVLKVYNSTAGWITIGEYNTSTGVWKSSILDTANTWAATQTFSGDVAVTGTITENGSPVLTDADTGTAIGDVVELESVGGSAGLPAVDGSQLTGLATYLTQTTDTVELGGDFDAGESVKCTRIGNQVTISGVGVLGHSLESEATSASGVIPAAYRPSTDRGNVYYVSGSGTYTARVLSSGIFIIMHRDTAFNLVSRGSSVDSPSITYNV